MIVAKDKLTEALKEALSENNNPKRNFKQSVDIIVSFRGVDMKKNEIKLREIVPLPKAPTKERKVLVVPTFEQLESAKKAEPNVVLTKEDLQKLNGQKRVVRKYARDNDWFLIAPESMSIAGRILGPALGPRGKFPTPLPTAADVSEYILRFKHSTIVKTKDQPHVQTFIGNEDQKPEDLADNAMAVLSAIEGKVKNISYIKAIYVKTTMGKPVQIKMK
ncbi:50S ribosomal protein L1 [Acidianus sulfidivorans JP7]|uniref:Large ribosomal subunit protein uL1 n=1 Tax=Acidianus sulfidivorans JP7 TaxID=619593 RepID=A0A2U9IP03_9CREN|nr:50S ribosomal protein L1 [Acidianus sulfidivorans]AWR97717.1 50S ribosomal protein L1 [Acidianus sulfidivorans JP7]